MKFNFILLFITCCIFSCSESPSVGISKLPNFIKGSVSQESSSQSVAILKKIIITGSGDSIVSEQIVDVGANGTYEFTDISSGDYVVLLKNETEKKAAIIQNISHSYDSIILSDVTLQEVCTINGKVISENDTKVFIPGLVSTDVKDSMYELKGVPKGAIDVAITNGRAINVMPIEISGSKAEYKLNSVEFNDVQNEDASLISFYNSDINSYIIKSFVDSVGEVKNFYPDENGNLEEVFNGVKIVFDDFEDEDKYSKINPEDSRDDNDFGIWYTLKDEYSTLLTSFDDLSSIYKTENNNQYLSFNILFSDSIGYRFGGFGCTLASDNTAPSNMSKLESITFRARGNCEFDFGLIQKKGYSDTTANIFFKKMVLLTPSWKEYTIDVDDLRSNTGEVLLENGLSWDDVNHEMLYMQFYTDGAKGDTATIELDDVIFNGLNLEDL